jgi:hypothetical protein
MVNATADGRELDKLLNGSGGPAAPGSRDVAEPLAEVSLRGSAPICGGARPLARPFISEFPREAAIARFDGAEGTCRFDNARVWWITPRTNSPHWMLRRDYDDG